MNLIIELQHDKTNKMTCATNEDSDQTGHMPSLIKSPLYAQWVVKDLMLLHVDSEDCDQPGHRRAHRSLCNLR